MTVGALAVSAIRIDGSISSLPSHEGEISDEDGGLFVDDFVRCVWHYGLRRLEERIRVSETRFKLSDCEDEMKSFDDNDDAWKMAKTTSKDEDDVQYDSSA